jgi:alkanesulfonate monooxygenase SsuD/methylene tetrahydromethanopterin reductase-like flavin-dependent oxidoreductase (luciferase family)
MTGKHFTVDPVRFAPRPVQQPRIPVWVGGVLPASRPIARAARWDGMVPIRYSDGALVRVSAEDIAAVRDQITAARGSADGFDLVIWAEVEQAPGDVARVAPAYQDAGATWWIESARPQPGWWEGVTARVARGR